MKYTYLLINFFAVLVPFIFSFHPRIKFHKTWKYFFPAMMLVAILFIIWDVIFTKAGVWSFNEKHISGVFLFQLPVEEILFFFCIPFSCVFTYYCLDKFFNLSWDVASERNFSGLLILFLILAGIVFRDRQYTMVSFISTAVICFLVVYVARVSWFGKAVTIYSLLLIPFFIVNGLLTGTGLDEPVVMYNNAENMNIRLLTIPVEDIVYGFELFLLNIFLFKIFEHKMQPMKESRQGKVHVAGKQNILQE
jgi:lycopene cyclase domain-containing protein